MNAKLVGKKTCQVVEEENVPYYRIAYLLRTGQIPYPVRDGSGDLVWSDADVAALRKTLARREMKRKVEVVA